MLHIVSRSLAQPSCAAILSPSVPPCASIPSVFRSSQRLSIPCKLVTSQSPTPGTPLPLRNPSRLPSSSVKSGFLFNSYEIRFKSTPQAFPFSDSFALAHGPPCLAPYILSVSYYSPSPSFPSRPSSACCACIQFLFLSLVSLTNGQCTPRGMSPDYSHLSFTIDFDLSCFYPSCNCLLLVRYINPRAGLLVGPAIAPSPLLFPLRAL